MVVSSVTNAVVVDARKIAKNYEIQLEDTRKQKLSELNKTIEKIKSKKKENLKERLTFMAKTETSRTNLEIKRKRLRMEHDILEELLKSVKKNLEDLDLETRDNLLKKLVSVATLEYIYSNQKDQDFLKKIVGKRYKGTTDCIGGILTEDPSGKIREEFTFESIMTTIFNNNIKEIRDILLGEAEYGFECNIF
jgi:V/A-type H+-transporting ATPase subunit E